MHPGHRPSHQVPPSPGGTAQGIANGQTLTQGIQRRSWSPGTRPTKGTNTHPPRVKQDSVRASTHESVRAGAHPGTRRRCWDPETRYCRSDRVYAQTAQKLGHRARARSPPLPVPGTTLGHRAPKRTPPRPTRARADALTGRAQRRAGPLRQQRNDGDLVAV